MEDRITQLIGAIETAMMAASYTRGDLDSESANAYLVGAIDMMNGATTLLKRALHEEVKR